MSFHIPGTVPAPVSLTAGTGRTVVADGTRVVVDAPLRPAARWWCDVVRAASGVDLLLLPPADASAPDGYLPAGAPVVVWRTDPALPAGGYRLAVDADGVRVGAADLAGAHAAAQTLRQLAGPRAFRSAPIDPDELLEIPHVDVLDHPRLPWRGVLLDVARHFLPPREVMRFVDLAAAHHLNVVQLHLTDDQGWRMPVPAHPLLTEVGAWRRESNVGTWRAGVLDGRPHGGRYSRDDLREIVAHARARGVTVVPEIDVPGHVEAAVAAYPHLGTRKVAHEVRTTWGISTEVLDPSEESLAFFRDVLDEVMDVFDSPWVALGGDEVPTALWRANPDIVARAAALGLDDVADLHGWFLGRLCAHVSAAGRRPVVWDEAFGPALPPDAVVTSWRGFGVGAAALEAGYDVVMAPEQAVYLDHRAGDGDDEPVPVGFLHRLEDVAAFDPLPDALVADRPALRDAGGTLLGAQAEVWTEHLDSPRRVDYATWPRLAAFAETVWSPAADRTPGSPASRELLARLEHDHLPRLDAAGVEYRPLAGPHPWQTRPGVAGWPRDLAAETAAAGWDGAGGWREDAEGVASGEGLG